MRDDTTLFFMIFRDEYLPGGMPLDDPSRKLALSGVFANLGWECPQILSALQGASEVYFDSVSQIRCDRWVKGSTVLVGDAAACPSLVSGSGAGLALAGAYVLAGELHRHSDDPNTALANYEALMKPFVQRKQRQATTLVSSFVPKSALGVSARNFATTLMRLPGFPKLLMGRYLRDDITLPDYGI